MRRIRRFTVFALLFTMLFATSCSGAGTAEKNTGNPEISEVGMTEGSRDTGGSEPVVAGTAPTVNDELRKIYQKALTDLYEKKIWPGTEDVCDFQGEDISENEFAIVDVDNDGVEELLINWNKYSGMAYRSEILEFDLMIRRWETEGYYAPYGSEFYDNGVMFVPISHNQGYGNRVYPYNFHFYDASADEYLEREEKPYNFIYCYDTEYYEGWSDLPDWFVETDKENAGVVYFIDAEGYDPEKPYSQSEYDEFLDNLVGNANRINVEFKALTIDNINGII